MKSLNKQQRQEQKATGKEGFLISKVVTLHYLKQNKKITRSTKQ